MFKVITIPVGMLRTNCYLVFDEENKGFVIDPGAQGDVILKKIKKHDVKIESILLTHSHHDHIEAVNEVKAATGAKVVCHEDNRDTINEPAFNLAALLRGSGEEITVDHFLKDGEDFTVGSMTFKTLQTKGHTDGSVCFISYGHDDMGNRVIFSGDTLFYESVGRVDFPGGSMDKMKKSLQKLIRLEGDYTVYPGHERSTTLSHERKRNPYIWSLD